MGSLESCESRESCSPDRGEAEPCELPSPTSSCTEISMSLFDYMHEIHILVVESEMLMILGINLDGRSFLTMFV